MNTQVREKLEVVPDHVRWGSQSDLVYYALYDEMMRPVISVVDEILEKTDLHIFIYNGQLDLICNTPGKLRAESTKPSLKSALLVV